MPQDNTARERHQGDAPRRVTIVPPVFGPAPSPPAALVPALDLLHALHVGPRDRRDAAVDSSVETLRFVVATIFDESYPPPPMDYRPARHTPGSTASRRSFRRRISARCVSTRPPVRLGTPPSAPS